MSCRSKPVLSAALTAGVCLPLLLVAEGADVRREFRVRDYGAAPNSDDDAGPAIRAAVAAAIGSEAPAEVVFDKGVYCIGAGPEGDYALTVARARDLILRGQGQGTGLVVTDPQVGAIRLSNCEAVTVVGLTVDYAPAPFAQGTVADVDLSLTTAPRWKYAGCTCRTVTRVSRGPY